MAEFAAGPSRLEALDTEMETKTTARGKDEISLKLHMFTVNKVKISCLEIKLRYWSGLFSELKKNGRSFEI